MGYQTRDASFSLFAIIISLFFLLVIEFSTPIIASREIGNTAENTISFAVTQTRSNLNGNIAMTIGPTGDCLFDLDMTQTGTYYLSCRYSYEKGSVVKLEDLPSSLDCSYAGNSLELLPSDSAYFTTTPIPYGTSTDAYKQSAGVQLIVNHIGLDENTTVPIGNGHKIRCRARAAVDTSYPAIPIMMRYADQTFQGTPAQSLIGELVYPHINPLDDPITITITRRPLLPQIVTIVGIGAIRTDGEFKVKLENIAQIPVSYALSSFELVGDCHAKFLVLPDVPANARTLTFKALSLRDTNLWYKCNEINLYLTTNQDVEQRISLIGLHKGITYSTYHLPSLASSRTDSDDPTSGLVTGWTQPIGQTVNMLNTYTTNHCAVRIGLPRRFTSGSDLATKITLYPRNQNHYIDYHIMGLWYAGGNIEDTTITLTQPGINTPRLAGLPADSPLQNVERFDLNIPATNKPAAYFSYMFFSGLTKYRNTNNDLVNYKSQQGNAINKLTYSIEYWHKNVQITVKEYFTFSNVLLNYNSIEIAQTGFTPKSSEVLVTLANEDNVGQTASLEIQFASKGLWNVLNTFEFTITNIDPTIANETIINGFTRNNDNNGLYKEFCYLKNLLKTGVCSQYIDFKVKLLKSIPTADNNGITLTMQLIEVDKTTRDELQGYQGDVLINDFDLYFKIPRGVIPYDVQQTGAPHQITTAAVLDHAIRTDTNALNTKVFILNNIPLYNFAPQLLTGIVDGNAQTQVPSVIYNRQLPSFAYITMDTTSIIADWLKATTVQRTIQWSNNIPFSTLSSNNIEFDTSTPWQWEVQYKCNTNTPKTVGNATPTRNAANNNAPQVSINGNTVLTTFSTAYTQCRDANKWFNIKLKFGVKLNDNFVIAQNNTVNIWNVLKQHYASTTTSTQNSNNVLGLTTIFKVNNDIQYVAMVKPPMNGVNDLCETTFKVTTTNNGKNDNEAIISSMLLPIIPQPTTILETGIGRIGGTQGLRIAIDLSIYHYNLMKTNNNNNLYQIQLFDETNVTKKRLITSVILKSTQVTITPNTNDNANNGPIAIFNAILPIPTVKNVRWDFLRIILNMAATEQALLINKTPILTLHSAPMNTGHIGCYPKCGVHGTCDEYLNFCTCHTREWFGKTCELNCVIPKNRQLCDKCKDNIQTMHNWGQDCSYQPVLGNLTYAPSKVINNNDTAIVLPGQSFIIAPSHGGDDSTLQFDIQYEGSPYNIITITAQSPSFEPFGAIIIASIPAVSPITTYHYDMNGLNIGKGLSGIEFVASISNITNTTSIPIIHNPEDDLYDDIIGEDGDDEDTPPVVPTPPPTTIITIPRCQNENREDLCMNGGSCDVNSGRCVCDKNSIWQNGELCDESICPSLGCITENTIPTQYNATFYDACIISSNNPTNQPLPTCNCDKTKWSGEQCEIPTTCSTTMPTSVCNAANGEPQLAMNMTTNEPILDECTCQCKRNRASNPGSTQRCTRCVLQCVNGNPERTCDKCRCFSDDKRIYSWFGDYCECTGITINGKLEINSNQFNVIRQERDIINNFLNSTNTTSNTDDTIIGNNNKFLEYQQNGQNILPIIENDSFRLFLSSILVALLSDYRDVLQTYGIDTKELYIQNPNTGQYVINQTSINNIATLRTFDVGIDTIQNDDGKGTTSKYYVTYGILMIPDRCYNPKSTIPDDIWAQTVQNIHLVAQYLDQTNIPKSNNNITTPIGNDDNGLTPITPGTMSKYPDAFVLYDPLCIGSTCKSKANDVPYDTQRFYGLSIGFIFLILMLCVLNVAS